MPSHTFNEFKRELDKRIKDPQVAYMMALMYERFGDLIKQQEMLAAGLVSIANSVQGFVNLNEVMQKKMVLLSQGKSLDDGVDVGSVLNTPEEDNRH